MNTGKTFVFVMLMVLSVKFAVAETPVAETPVAETPVAETPVAETPVAETPIPKLSVKEIVEEPIEQEGSAVFICDSEGGTHYAFYKKSGTGLVLMHDGKAVVSFDALFDKAPTLSDDGKSVACWVKIGSKVILLEGNKGIVAVEEDKLGDCDLFAKPSGKFIAKCSIKTQGSYVYDGYRYYLYQTFVISGAEKWGPFGRANIDIPKEGDGVLVLATKSAGSSEYLEKGITEWILLRDGKLVKSWPTNEPLDVPRGMLWDFSSDFTHYICALRTSTKNWQVVVDGEVVDNFDGAMVGTPQLCIEGEGNNRIVTGTLSISEDGKHWAYWRITPAGVQMVLDGKHQPWCDGWYAIEPILITNEGTVMPFMAVKAVQQTGTGSVVPYSKEWEYKWGVYTGEEALIVDGKPLPSLYGHIKLLVTSEDKKHYAYAGLKGELTGVTLSRAGYSQDFEGSWHVVCDGKEGRPWSDIRVLEYLPRTGQLAAIVCGLKDKDEEKDKVFVVLDGVPVASHESAWGLQAEAGSLIWFSREGKKIFLNRLTIP